MKLHWKVLLWMLAGAVLGFVIQKTLDAPAWAGATWEISEATFSKASPDSICLRPACTTSQAGFASAVTGPWLPTRICRRCTVSPPSGCSAKRSS